LAVFILKIPELGTESIGDALEWVFYVTLPNFCFSKALQDLHIKHQIASICSEIPDLTLFCDLMHKNNRTNPCCPGEMQDPIIIIIIIIIILIIIIIILWYVYFQ